MFDINTHPIIIIYLRRLGSCLFRLQLSMYLHLVVLTTLLSYALYLRTCLESILLPVLSMCSLHFHLLPFHFRIDVMYIQFLASTFISDSVSSRASLHVISLFVVIILLYNESRTAIGFVNFNNNLFLRLSRPAS